MRKEVGLCTASFCFSKYKIFFDNEEINCFNRVIAFNNFLLL